MLRHKVCMAFLIAIMNLMRITVKKSSYSMLNKMEAEKKIKTLDDDNFTVVSFRPSTVFGASPRLRCDIVYNSLIACAYTTGKIEILSDGSPWRPVIHVKIYVMLLLQV